MLLVILICRKCVLPASLCSQRVRLALGQGTFIRHLVVSITLACLRLLQLSLAAGAVLLIRCARLCTFLGDSFGRFKLLS